MATNLYNLFKPLPFLVSNAHFWLRHRCFLRVSPKKRNKSSARRFSSSYLMEERCRNSHHVAELQCKVCHLLWSRAGVAHVFIEWNHQPMLLLATRLQANRDTKSFQYEFFFCWRLLGLIPGGTPFSQLNKGVRDAMSATTKRDVKHQVLQKHAKGHRYQQSPNTGQRRQSLTRAQRRGLRWNPKESTYARVGRCNQRKRVC